MKKKIAIMISILAVIVLVVHLYDGYRDKNEFKMDVVSYLENRGYSYETDIEKITIINLGEKGVIFGAVVNFKYEPMADYIYSYNIKSKEMHQIDYYNHDPSKLAKHREK